MAIVFLTFNRDISLIQSFDLNLQNKPELSYLATDHSHIRLCFSRPPPQSAAVSIG